MRQEIEIVRRRSSLGSGLLTGCLVGLLVACGVGASLLLALYQWIKGSTVGSMVLPETSGTSPLVHLALVVLVLLVAHGLTLAWTYRARPGWSTVGLTQGPYVAAYAMIPVWWHWGSWSPWYLAWGAAGAVSVGWLLVWWLPDRSAGRRRAIFAAVLGGVLTLNAAGVGLLTWSRTNGLGLRGQPNPWSAVNTFTSVSCMDTMSFHWNGSNLVESQCPGGPDGNYYAGEYDRTGMDSITCNDQPESAFTKWWEWNKQYQVEFRMEFDIKSVTVDGQPINPPYPYIQKGDKNYPAEFDGKSATVITEMQLVSASSIGVENPYKVTAEKVTEEWTVQLEPVALGGWKVCQVTISDPISPQFTRG